MSASGNVQSVSPRAQSLVRPSAGAQIPRAELTIEPPTSRALGKGGFGEVRLATWASDGVLRRVAVKTVLSQQHALDNEISLHVRFRHERIVHAYGYTEEPPGSWALVMEAMASSADKLFVGRPPAPIMSKLRVLADAAAGLAYLHGLEPQPVQHKDVKAANILLDDAKYPRAKIADFGLSDYRCADLGATTGLGAPGPPAVAAAAQEGGTPGYEAPELLRGEPSSRRTDVYAFGVTMWEVRVQLV